MIRSSKNKTGCNASILKSEYLQTRSFTRIKELNSYLHQQRPEIK